MRPKLCLTTRCTASGGRRPLTCVPPSPPQTSEYEPATCSRRFALAARAEPLRVADAGRVPDRADRPELHAGAVASCALPGTGETEPAHAGGVVDRLTEDVSHRGRAALRRERRAAGVRTGRVSGEEREDAERRHLLATGLVGVARLALRQPKARRRLADLGRIPRGGLLLVRRRRRHARRGLDAALLERGCELGASARSSAEATMRCIVSRAACSDAPSSTRACDMSPSTATCSAAAPRIPSAVRVLGRARGSFTASSATSASRSRVRPIRSVIRQPSGTSAPFGSRSRNVPVVVDADRARGRRSPRRPCRDRARGPPPGAAQMANAEGVAPPEERRLEQERSRSRTRRSRASPPRSTHTE